MFQRIGAMIGSPGDAAQERQAITDTILRWNAVNGADKETFLEAVKWETHATPGLQGRPQGMINEELIPMSDFLIAVFRVRAGSPTGKEISGTIEEIREFMALGKYVVVYFYEGETSVKGLDADQLKKVQDFKKEIQQHGLVESYSTVPDLQAKLGLQLSAIVKRLENRTPNGPKDRTPDIGKKRSKSITKKKPAISPRKAKGKPVRKPSTSTNTKAVVSDSGRWVLLNTRFFEANFVRRNKDQTISVEIPSASADEDAAMTALHPHHFGRAKPIPFAHGNDAWIVTVKEMESVSKGDGQLWTLTLAPEKVEYGGSVMEMSLSTGGKHYSADDIARMRAGRILLNDPPAMSEKARRPTDPALMEEAILESYIQGMNNPASVTKCVIQTVYKDCQKQPSQFLPLARLAAIYFLKAGGVVELIQEMTLGPVEKGFVQVEFRGVRSQKFGNVEPSIIKIEGKCSLE